ncbi:CAP domain-containing protein [Pelagibacterium limicola]|uniref:CAP domain-containing protein n=1 Tax=Pelagibacterium limicola TaxID=2791022 RepID=UPI0018AF845D|nr:CAP domain-containing protein [Pelagibacterium limicola]
MNLMLRRDFLLGLAATGGALLVSGCSTAPVIMATERATPVSSVSPAEARVALNAMRRENGLAELTHNAMLQAVAEEQAGIMARTTKVAHTAEKDQPFIERLRRAGFWGGAGENLAGGPPNLATVIDGWMKSPAHHKVMINPDYVQFGISVKRGPATTFNTYGTYWALIMGVRSPGMTA